MRNTIALSCLAAAVAMTSVAHAQLAPEIGYLFPSGAQRGTTVNLLLGGYDSTSDIQVFFDDPRIKLELTGEATPVLVPEPPYWFGAKARGPAWPLMREFPAKLTIPADVPAGLIRWQIANANGVSPVATLHVGDVPEVVEDESRTSAQKLPDLPVTVSGRIRRIEEIDRYEFQAKQSGIVTVEVIARKIDSQLHAMLKLYEVSPGQPQQEKLILDLADSEGRDFAAPFLAEAGKTYAIALHDLDFAGDRSYVYRLHLSSSPRILAAYPAAGRRGEKRSVEFFGVGLATGALKVESITKDVEFPKDVESTSFTYQLPTPRGASKPFLLGLSDITEQVLNVEQQTASTGAPITEFPAAVTSSIRRPFGMNEHLATFKKGDKLTITAQARVWSSPLDLELAVINAEGKEVASNDDVVGTTDATLSLVVATDGDYRIVVGDRSGKADSRSANYRLLIEPQREDFSTATAIPALLSVPLGDKAKLALKFVRSGGQTGPITVKFQNLPEGVTVPEELTVPDKKNDLAVELTCDAGAAAVASRVTVTATSKINGEEKTKTLGKLLIATVMKPRFKITPEGLDDVRKVHRGSTFLAPLLIERLEGYEGPITLEMTSKQQRHRQGLASDEFVVKPDETRVEYPIFVPEWMETTKTSRMILNGTTKLPDPKGNVRTLVQRMQLRIGVLPEGALMKLSAAVTEPIANPGGELRIPLQLSRATLLRDPVQITFVPTGIQQGLISAEPVIMPADKAAATFALRLAADSRLVGEQALQFRAHTLQDGRWPVVAEVSVTAVINAPK